MECELWGEKLDAYADGELCSADAKTLGEHLRQCSSCAADVLERVQMKRAVAAAGNNYAPSATFRERIRQSVAKPARDGRWVWQFVAVAASLAVVLLAAGLFYSGSERARRERVYGELADLHVATLASATPVDVVSTDRHTVKPWFEGRIPFTFNLPELQGTEFSLLGGRVTYLGQAPGAQLIYRIRKHEISVFIFQDRGSEAHMASGPVSALSFHVESWAEHGLQYFVVGDVGGDDLEALGKLFRTAQ